MVEIFTDKLTWLKKPHQRLVIPSNDVVKTFSFAVPYGKYAVTVYQDLNGNGEPDMNFLGIPKELVGFGNNYKPFGEPKFESSLINFTSDKQPETIKLYNVF